MTAATTMILKWLQNDYFTIIVVGEVIVNKSFIPLFSYSGRMYDKGLSSYKDPLNKCFRFGGTFTPMGHRVSEDFGLAISLFYWCCVSVQGE